MWQYLHTSIIVLFLFTLSSQAQFSGAWSNWYGTETIAAEAYSGSVERCQAVSVAADSPSYWDYVVGKNRAKLVSVKRNLSAVRPYVIKAKYADNDGTFTNWLSTNNLAFLTYSNDAEWCAAVGLVTNYLAETPWFSLQAKSTSNGWQGCYDLLTNAVWFKKSLTNALTINDGRQYAGASTNSYSDAFASMVMEYTNSLGGDYGYMNAYASTGGAPDYIVTYHMTEFWGIGQSNRFLNGCTNIQYSTDFYSLALSPFDGYGQFDAINTSLIETNYNIIAVDGEALHPADFRLYSSHSEPTYIAPPAEWYGWKIPQYVSEGKGFAVNKFNGTNGFKYK